jgi:hypothetical protein
MEARFERLRQMFELREFDDHQSAMAERFEKERQIPGEAGVEIVVLSSSSRENLERTHSRYFRSVPNLLTPG